MAQAMASQQLPAHASSAPEGRSRAIFCKGLAKGASERCIASLFTKFGAVVDCQIARHRSGRSAGFAIVTFASHEEAKAALSGMESTAFMGRPLSCRWYQQERDGVEGLLIQPPKLPALQQQPMHAGDALLRMQQQQHSAPGSHLLHQHLSSPRHIQQLPLPLPPLALQQHRPRSPADSSAHPAPGPASLTAAASAHEGWGSLPQPAIGAATKPPAATDEGPDGNRRWSAMVNLWLQDYLDQDVPALPGHSSVSEPGLDNFLRRSFDSFPPPGTVTAAAERRRSSRDSLSRCLDSLNLAAGGSAECGWPYSLGGSSGGAVPCDATFLSKSRLATKWTTEGSSNGGGGSNSREGMTTGANAAAVAGLLGGNNGGRSSDDFHVLADIKLLSSALSCPPDAAPLLSAWSAAASGAGIKLDGAPSAPATAANSPPGKLLPLAQHRSCNWRPHDDSGRRQQFRDSNGGQPAGSKQAPGNVFLGTTGAGAPVLPQQQQQQALHAQALHAAQAAQAAASAAQQQQQQVHQLAAMHQAQEQYVSALNQLTSAHSQVLAAAAALQGAGMLPPGPAMPPMVPPVFSAAAPSKLSTAPAVYPYGSMGHAPRPTANNYMMRAHAAPHMSHAMF